MKPQHTPTPSDTQPPVPISITICGDGGCGKSSITLRLVRSQWTSDYDPTIEDSYSITRRIDGIVYHLSLTDTAGQEEYRGMWASSNLGADAFLLVYDITSSDSLLALDYFNELIDMEAETRLENAQRARNAGLNLSSLAMSPTMPDPSSLSSSTRARANVISPDFAFGSGTAKTVPPIKIVAGNKCDLHAEARQVPAAMGLEWARARGCGFMETSARLEVNIEETFALIVRRVVEARRMMADGTYDPHNNNTHPQGGKQNSTPGGTCWGVTKPLTPLPPAGDDEDEKGGRGRGPGVRGPNIGGAVRIGGGGFWKKLRCW